jgi:DNA-binding transcriptional MocR family regulator/dihydrodipicolinate reductase
MEQYGQYTVKPASELMMLGVGQPSPQILTDANNFIKLNQLENHDINLLQYGLKQGFSSYRKFIKRLLNSFSSTHNYDEINEDNIYMTNGISQSVFMISSLLRSIYDTVYVEELTYFIMINVFKDLKYNIKTFNVSDLYKLKTDLENENSGAIVYLIPFCNNPSGKSMSLEDINYFSSILPENCICLSDETYQFLQFEHNFVKLANRSLALYSDNIISLGTFSKILAPGIRLGWMYTNYKYNGEHFYKFLDDTGFMDSGGSVNPLIAHMITNYISGNFDSYKNFIDSIKLNLEDKQKIVIDSLLFYNGYFEVIKPDGGYFVFVKSLKLNSSRLLELANICGISFHIGNKFAPNKNYDDWFRLSVSYYSREDFLEYFTHRIQNLVKLIDLETQNKYEVSLFGNGKLGKQIVKEFDDNKMSNPIKYNLLTRNFRNEQIGDIIIDVTNPNGTIELIKFLTEKKLNKKLIIGTTGHSPEDIELIKDYSKNNAIVLCPNFSNGIQNLIKMIRSLDKVWKNAIILDVHHINKKDSPSGTALLLKKELKKLKIPTSIESERKGEVIGLHTITLIGDNEQLTITHNAENRDIFAKGCVNLIEKIKIKNNGLYDFI